MTIAKPIKEYFTSKHSHVTQLVRRAKELQELNTIFRTALNNNDLSQHCAIAKIEERQLLLEVENAAWATPLRFAIPDIIKTLKAQPEFHHLEKIRYYIKRVPTTE